MITPVPPYTRDPLSEWFDRVAADWLERAYRRPGRWAELFLAPPSPARREQARTELGIASLAEKDRYGLDRWTRGLKRATYWNHKAYWAGSEDTAQTAIRWDTGPLVRKAGWPQRRRQLRIMVVPGGVRAYEAATAGRGRAYVSDEDYRSKPGPPDRPWEGG